MAEHVDFAVEMSGENIRREHPFTRNLTLIRRIRGSVKSGNLPDSPAFHCILADSPLLEVGPRPTP